MRFAYGSAALHVYVEICIASSAVSMYQTNDSGRLILHKLKTLHVIMCRTFLYIDLPLASRCNTNSYQSQLEELQIHLCFP